MGDRGSDGSGENRALARARAALDHAKRVMDVGAAKGPDSSPAPPPAPAAFARRNGADGMIALLFVMVLLIILVYHYRSRVVQMTKDVSELSATVTAVQEQQKTESRLQAKRVEALTRELTSLKETAEKPRRGKFLGIF
ncbi:MAG: hypothetical protein WCP22_06720 [Chlamydiota bacterium]